MTVIDEPVSSKRHQQRWRFDFALLCTGSAVSSFGSRASGVAYPLLALTFTGSPFIAGLIRFANTLPNLILYLPAGVIADRYDLRRLMLVSQIVRGIAVASVAISVIDGNLSVPIVIAAAGVEGSLAVVYSLSEFSTISHIVPTDYSASAISKKEGSETLAKTSGQSLGGLFFGISQALPFITDVVSYIISVMTILAMRTRQIRSKSTRSSLHFGKVKAELIEGFAWLWKDSFLRTATIVCTGVNLLSQVEILILIVLAKEQGASSFLIGVILAATGVGGVLGSLGAPRILKWLSQDWALGVGAWLWFAALAAIALATRPYTLALAWAGFGCVAGFLNVVMRSYEMNAIPKHLFIRVLSVGNFLSFGTIPLGALLGGYFITIVGARQAAVVVAVITSITASFATVQCHRMHRERRVREPEGEN